jgi:hypothetical protein
MAQINSIAGRYRNPVSGGGPMPTRFTFSSLTYAGNISAAQLVGGVGAVNNTAGAGNLSLPTMAQVRAELKNEVDEDSFTFTLISATVSTPAAIATVVNTDFTAVVGSLAVMAGTSGTFLIQLPTSTTMTITRVG